MTSVALADTPAPALHKTAAEVPAAAPKWKVAPADEYFGKLKMSVLGIQNVIRDMRLRVEADPSKTPTIFGSLAYVEDALHDWEKKYPADTWIARDLFALEVTYLEASGDFARTAAIRTESWLRKDYPHSPGAAQGHLALARALTPAPPQLVDPERMSVNPPPAAAPVVVPAALPVSSAAPAVPAAAASAGP
jgi:hypothetical protein